MSCYEWLVTGFNELGVDGVRRNAECLEVSGQSFVGSVWCELSVSCLQPTTCRVRSFERFAAFGAWRAKQVVVRICSACSPAGVWRTPVCGLHVMPCGHTEFKGASHLHLSSFGRGKALPCKVTWPTWPTPYCCPSADRPVEATVGLILFSKPTTTQLKQHHTTRKVMSPGFC